MIDIREQISEFFRQAKRQILIYQNLQSSLRKAVSGHIRREFVNRFKIIFFKVGKIFQDLLLGHTGGQITQDIFNGKAKPSDTGFTAKFVFFNRNAGRGDRILNGHTYILSVNRCCCQWANQSVIAITSVFR